MQKLKRSDAGIDYVKLLSDHAGARGFSEYTDAAIQAFGDVLQQSLANSARSEPRLRGLRVEALFQTVVAALGQVRLIKTEDSGDVFYSGEDILVPDYRIATNEGPQLLVEVKAVRGAPFSGQLGVSDAYMQKLQRYASVTGAQLRFAIYWERTGWWTLNRPDSFSKGAPGERRWRISFSKAFASNEMIALGDAFVATWAPLRVRAVFDPDGSDPMQPGETGTFRLRMKGMRILSQDRELHGEEARLAWRLMWYGRWQEAAPEPHFEGDHMIWIDYPVVPSHWGDPECDPASSHQIGFLSEMISAAYLRGAVKTIHSTTKGGVLRPGYMADFIPSDWFSVARSLPLVVARIEPNFSFDEATNPEPEH